MNLPNSESLPVHILAACFKKTSATYKYYWLLSILQEVENGESTIKKERLVARMIANAWYTVNYFHISFGKQDLIQAAISELKKLEEIPIEEKQTIVFQKLIESHNPRTKNLLLHFDNNVPHWFLSPWFPRKNKTDIYHLSKNFLHKCLYALYNDRIVINPEWNYYLSSNSRLLKDFCYWNLTLFLQSKNPNVPDIPNKLIKPAQRNNLSKQRKFWNLVFEEKGNLKCIYTGVELTIDNYAVEHFIPYNFVSHDLIWNLIPADKTFNSSKSDKLPIIDRHFNGFFELQKLAIEVIYSKFPRNKLLEDYLTIFPDLNDVSSTKFRERIEPLITIASNNGFEFLL